MEKAKDKTTFSEIQGQMPGTILEELAREGARQLLAQALEAEVEEFLQKHQDKIDIDGRRQVVRNGYMPARQLVTGIGPVRIRQPRLDDRELKEGAGGRFSSQILPRYLRVESRGGAVPAKTNPFPPPAHRTGRADLPHPALGLDSPQAFERRVVRSLSRQTSPYLLYSLSSGNRRVPLPFTLCLRQSHHRSRARTR